MVTALSKTDGSLGRVKNTLPGSDPSPDLDYYETAAEHERQKDALIEHANALNGGGAKAEVLQTGPSSVTVTKPNTLVIANVDDTIDSGTIILPLASASSGFFVAVRKVSGSDGVGIRLVFTAGDQFEGVLVSTLTPANEYTIPGSNIGSEPTIGGSAGDEPYITNYTFVSDGVSWRYGPGTPRSRFDPYLGSSYNAAPPTLGRAEGFAPGSLLLGTFRDASGLPGTTRAWLQTGIKDDGTGIWTPVGHMPVITVTADANLPRYDAIILVDTTASAVTLTAPPNGTLGNTGNNTGRQYLIIKTNTGTNKITLARASGVNVNGANANLDLPGSATAAIGRWHSVNDGTNWWVG